MNAILDIRMSNLIQALKDGEMGYSTAACDATRPDLKRLFLGYALDRARFAFALQAHWEREGGESALPAGADTALHRGWTGAGPALRDDHAILADCERGDDSALAAYRESMVEIDEFDRSIVQEQYTCIRSAHSLIRTLRDSLKPAAQAACLTGFARRHAAGSSIELAAANRFRRGTPAGRRATSTPASRP